MRVKHPCSDGTRAVRAAFNRIIRTGHPGNVQPKTLSWLIDNGLIEPAHEAALPPGAGNAHEQLALFAVRYAATPAAAADHSASNRS